MLAVFTTGLCGLYNLTDRNVLLGLREVCLEKKYAYSA